MLSVKDEESDLLAADVCLLFRAKHDPRRRHEVDFSAAVVVAAVEAVGKVERSRLSPASPRHGAAGSSSTRPPATPANQPTKPRGSSALSSAFATKKLKRTVSEKRVTASLKHAASKVN